jgi:glycosyltransferase involved in cell wall biosynthesis
MSETVTIGLPTYNSASTLFDAIASIFAQTYGDWRLIIIDDGSKDTTVDQLLRISDPRVTVIAEAENLGLAARLNQLAEMCETRLLFRMDADDVMHQDRVACQVEFMERNPEVDVLASRAYMIDEVGRVVGLFNESEIPRNPGDWFHGCGITHPTIVVRVEWALSHPYDVDLRRSQDLDLFIRASPTTTFAKLEQPLLYYRVASRLSFSGYRASRRHERAVIRRHSPMLNTAWETQWLVLCSFIKEQAVRAILAAGFGRRFQARRASRLSNSQLETAQAGCRSARTVRIPMLPDKLKG